MFNESTQNNCKIPYDEYYTERRLITDMNVQVDIGSAQQVSSSEKVYSNQGFVIIDNGSLGGTHWTCFITKDKKIKIL